MDLRKTSFGGALVFVGIFALARMMGAAAGRAAYRASHRAPAQAPPSAEPLPAMPAEAAPSWGTATPPPTPPPQALTDAGTARRAWTPRSARTRDHAPRLPHGARRP